jgi:Ca2+/Na+ antiporter
MSIFGVIFVILIIWTLLSHVIFNIHFEVSFSENKILIRQNNISLLINTISVALFAILIFSVFAVAKITQIWQIIAYIFFILLMGFVVYLLFRQTVKRIILKIEKQQDTILVNERSIDFQNIEKLEFVTEALNDTTSYHILLKLKSKEKIQLNLFFTFS